MVENVLQLYKSRIGVTLEDIAVVLKQARVIMEVNEISNLGKKVYCLHKNPRKNFSRWLLYALSLQVGWRKISKQQF